MTVGLGDLRVQRAAIAIVFGDQPLDDRAFSQRDARPGRRGSDTRPGQDVRPTAPDAKKYFCNCSKRACIEAVIARISGVEMSMFAFDCACAAGTRASSARPAARPSQATGCIDST